MKTLNGAPQFQNWHTYGDGELGVAQANQWLREWAESRRCVRCKWLSSKAETFCAKLALSFEYANLDEGTFSCAAFEPLSPIETAGGENG